MQTKQGISITTSQDGDGWAVVAGDARWRFNREGYAILFRDRLEHDEAFQSDIFSHAFTHDWEKCAAELCPGYRWQLIQAL
jgi:hypothetical protein